MKMNEAAAMLGVGAVLAVTAMWFSASPSEDETDTVAVAAPVETAPASEFADTDAQVTRAAATAMPLGSADRIHAIIAQAEDTIDSVQPLTPEQQEVVSFFEKIARDRNAEGSANPDAAVSFDNLTIDRLTVRYYYTAASRYETLDKDTLLYEQTALVQNNICNHDSMRQLISEYGISYNYRFISQDFRFIGEVAGDLAKCPA